MRARLVFLFVFVTFAVGLLQLPATGLSLTDDSLILQEAQTVYLGNLAREANGVPPLRWNRQLTEAGRWFSWDSVENRPDPYCGHQDTNGNWPNYRARFFGYLGFAGAENAFCGYVTPQQAIDGWMNSPGHRANLLDPNSREVGLGYYLRQSDGRGYVTQGFGTDIVFPPVIINNEALNTTNPTVDLYIYDRAAGGGFAEMGAATEMQISNDICFTDAAWQPYTAETVWNLNSGTGWRSVYVKTRDSLGRTTTVSDTIYLGTDVPVAEMSLHQAATTSDQVTIYNLDGQGLPQVQFSANWMVDDTFATFGLNWGNGERVNDAAALGGSAFRLRPGSGESFAWVWTTEFVKETPFMAYVRLKVSDNSEMGEVARFSINGGGVEYGPLSLHGADFTAANQYQEFALPFTFHDDPDNVFLTLNFWRSGNADVYVDAVYLFTAPMPITDPLTWSVLGSNYRGQGILQRYTDGSGQFSAVSEAQVTPGAEGITVVPDALDFTAVAYSASTPIQTVAVTQSGCTPTDWTVSDDASWLLTSRVGDNVQAWADAGNLGEGAYTAVLHITTSTETLAIPVTLTVTPSPFSPTWVKERVIDDKTFDALTQHNLAVDSQGWSHVVYGGDQLYYAWYNGVAWQYETVPTLPGSGWWASLALDEQDRPHVAFHNSTQHSLQYATKTAGTWHIETVEAGDSTVGWGTAVALDSNGYPHIAYNSGTQAALKYARWTGTDWQREVIVGPEGNIQHLSLALDGSDRPHISYYDATFPNGGTSGGTVKYVTKNGQAWTVTTASECQGNIHGGCPASIAVDSSDRPHISYTQQGNEDDHLVYAYWNGANWLTDTVDTIADGIGLTSHASLSLTSDDRPIIGYVDVVFNGSETESEVRVATWDGGNWLTDTVDTIPWQVLGTHHVALGLGADGQPHLAYFDIRGQSLYYATLPSGGVPQVMLLDETRRVGLAGMGLDAAAKPYLLHTDGSAALTIYESRSENGVWTDEMIANGRFPSLAMDNSGNPRLAFLTYGTTNTMLQYGAWNGISWVVNTAVTAPYLYNPLLQLSPTGIPHLLYSGPTGLTRAYLSGNSWLTQTLPISQQAKKFALGDDGAYHLTYYDYDVGLIYGQWLGGWLTATVAATTAVHDLALDNNSVPHMVYHSSAGIVYGTWSGGSWITETVMSSHAPLGGGGGQDYLALDFTADDQPVIVLSGMGSGMQAATKTAGVWQVETVDAAPNVGFTSKLAVDAQSSPVIAYTDNTNGDLKFAWRDWTVTMTTAGGTVYAHETAVFTFAPGVFSGDVQLRYQPVEGQADSAALAFVLTAEDVATGDPSEAVTYQIQLTYDPLAMPEGIAESDLGLFYWNGSQWLAEVTASFDREQNKVTAVVNRFGVWAVMVQREQQVYLPIVMQ